ncbi:uncharacterized protein VSU04_014070 isoform 1-T2 [Chlamydotis macqueenii]
MWLQRQMSNIDCMSPWASPASMQSLGSLSGSSSISMGSVYSFPEPWHGAMPELAALNSSGPPRLPKTVEAPSEERGPALGQPCSPAKKRALPSGAGGTAGMWRRLFRFLPFTARAEALSRKRLSPQASLASMESLGSLLVNSSSSAGSLSGSSSIFVGSLSENSSSSTGSLSGRSSISRGSVYSFPEPWHGAMPELAALSSSGPPRSPKALEAPWEERGPALGQDPPLAEPEHERVPADAEDAELPLSSHPPMSTTTRQLLRNFVNAVKYAEAVAKQHRQLLQGKLGQWRELGGGCREACGRTLPEEPSLPSTSLDAEVRTAAGGDEGTARDTATARSSRTELGRSSPTQLGRSSPTKLGRSSPAAGKRSSPVEPERSRSMGPGWSSPTNSDRSTPMGRDWVTPGLCKAGRCLREGCTWLWGWMKALWTSCF